MTNRRGVIRWVPVLRASEIEREAQDSYLATLYSKFRADGPVLDVHLPASTRRASLNSVLRFGAAADVEVLEVPEPLYVRYWPAAVAVIVLLRIARLVLGRKRLRVATLAIDNCPAAERLTIPSFDNWPRLQRMSSAWLLQMLRRSTSLVDDYAFGTRAAHRNYAEAGLIGERARCAIIPERLQICRCNRRLPKQKTVVFVGELSRRKGLPTLLEGWRLSGLAEAGWRLLLAGSRTDVVATLPAGVHDLGSRDREAVHRLLRQASIAVLPSEPVRRWREQVGLPALEGEAHDCRVVISDESGIAGDLAQRSGAVVFQAGSATSLAVALRQAGDLGPVSADGAGEDSKVRTVKFFRGESVAPCSLPSLVGPRV